MLNAKFEPSRLPIRQSTGTNVTRRAARNACNEWRIVVESASFSLCVSQQSPATNTWATRKASGNPIPGDGVEPYNHLERLSRLGSKASRRGSDLPEILFVALAVLQCPLFCPTPIIDLSAAPCSWKFDPRTGALKVCLPAAAVGVDANAATLLRSANCCCCSRWCALLTLHRCSLSHLIILSLQT